MLCLSYDRICCHEFCAEETVPVYSNLGLTATSICNYRMGHVSWVPGESPSNDHHENCDTPYAFFHFHFANNSTEEKFPTVYVKLKGSFFNNSLFVMIKMT